MKDTRIILMSSRCCGDVFKTVKEAFDKGENLFLAGADYFHIIDLEKGKVCRFKDGELDIITL